MKAPCNDFKRRLAAGEVLNGFWLSLASPVASEALSLAGFDWLLFDGEHSPVDVAGVQPLLQAAATGTASAVVRPAWNDKVLIKRLLDIGAQTLLVPFVQSAEEAAAAVLASRYPPHGVRGVAGATRASRYGQTEDYFAVANREICVLVQVETGEALGRLEEIAAVDGVDGVDATRGAGRDRACGARLSRGPLFSRTPPALWCRGAPAPWLCPYWAPPPRRWR